MTNQTPESVIAEVIEYHADAIGSHYDGCYKRHAVCLAVKLRDMLREPGAPDAATAWHDKSSAETAAVMNHELATTFRVQRDAALEMMNKHRCGEKNESLMEALVGARAERDAATAAIERVRARLGDILPDWSDSGVIAVADILAALDWAPEPEVGS